MSKTPLPTPEQPEGLTLKTFFIVTAIFSVFIGIFFQDSLFNETLIISAQDQLNHIGGKWFRTSFWLPHWDPNKIGGYPTLDATYGQPYHPLTWFRLIMDPAVALAWMFAGTVILGFCTATILGSFLTKSWRWGSILGLMFALNPQFFTHIYPGHDGKMMVIAIAPLGLYGILKYTRENSYWGLPIFSFSSLLAIMGHIQLGYFFLWGIFFFSIYENFLSGKKLSIRSKLIRQSMIGFALISGLGMASIQIIPPYKYTTTQSVRADSQQQSYGHSASWSNHLEETASLVLPGFSGYNVPNPNTQKYDNPYYGHNAFKLNHDSPGVILLILGLMGFFLKSKTRESLFLISAASLLVLYSVGGDTPVFKIFYEVVPGAKSFRAPSMVLFWIPILLMISASNVFNHISTNDRQRIPSAHPLVLIGVLGAGLTIIRFQLPEAKGGLTAFLSLIIIGLGFYFISAKYNGFKNIPKFIFIGLIMPILTLTFLGFSNGPSIEVQSYFSDLKDQLIKVNTQATLLSFFALMILSFIVFHLIHRRLDVKQKQIFLAILILISNISIISVFLQEKPRDQIIPEHQQIIKAIKSQNIDSINTFRTYNVNSRSINSNSGPFHGIRFLLGDHDNKLSTFRSFKGGRQSENFIYQLQNGFTKQNLSSNPFLNLMGVKSYLISNRQGQMQIAINDSAFTRAYFYKYIEKKPHRNIPEYLRSGTSDYQETLILDEELHPEIDVIVKPRTNFLGASATTTDSLPAVKTNPKATQPSMKFVSSNHSDFYKLEVDIDEDGFILFNENYHKDWRIEVDGKPVKPLRAFHTLLAFEVPAGQHQIHIQFISSAVESSKLWVYLGVLLFIGFLILAYKTSWNTKKI